MIDFGLLMSMIVGFGVPSLLVNWWPLTSYDEPVGFLDVALGPAFVGLAVGRLTALALDDPSSIGSISDMLIIRSGVEFWAGVAAASLFVAWGARRTGVGPVLRLADMVPLTMVGYAAYEAACVFRDGCFGPESSLGLVPPGLSTSMLPVGLLMAAAVAGSAVGLRRFALNGAEPMTVVLLGALSVATVRAIGSIWLPHVGAGLTRQHLTSIVVAIVAAAFIVGTLMLLRQRSESHTSA